MPGSDVQNSKLAGYTLRRWLRPDAANFEFCTSEPFGCGLAPLVDFDFIAFGASGVSVPVEVPEADPADGLRSGEGDSLAVLIVAADRLLDGDDQDWPSAEVSTAISRINQTVLTLAGAVAGPDQHASAVAAGSSTR